MKVLMLTLLLIAFTDPGKINKINSLKTEAKKAYLSGDYKTAVDKYKFLTDSLQIKEDEVSLNLANSYFNLSDTTNAQSAYQTLSGSTNPAIRSAANQQLGIINNQQGKFEEALANFKQAIKADPANKDARYNYEMLKKKLEEQKKKEEQQQQNKDDQQKQDQQQKDQKDQQKKDDQQKQDQEKKDDKKSDNKDEQSKKEEKKDEQQKKDQEQKDTEKPSEEKKETPPSTSEKLQQMKISEEKAKMLLEAMKNHEQQYLQQNKLNATKPKEKGKPDW